MSKVQKIWNVFAFIAAGITAIAVGFFMLRGTLNLWNRKSSNKEELSD